MVYDIVLLDIINYKTPSEYFVGRALRGSIVFVKLGKDMLRYKQRQLYHTDVTYIWDMAHLSWFWNTYMNYMVMWILIHVTCVNCVYSKNSATQIYNALTEFIALIDM